MKRETSDIEWSLPRQCKAVVVYDDLVTKQRAKELWDTIINEMGGDAQCSVTCLSAEQVEKVPVLKRVAQIDVVIVSMHDLARFLSNIAGWLADWMNADACLPRALFILHDGEADRQLVNFLRMLAEFAGVTMFSCGRETDCVWHGSHSERGRHLAELVAAVA